MNHFATNLAAWVADYYLLATLLLGVMLIARQVIEQPARRIAVAWGGTLSLLLLAVLVALPGWSVIHLLEHEEPAAPVVEPAAAQPVVPATRPPSMPTFASEAPPEPAPLSRLPEAPPMVEAAPVEIIPEVATAPREWPVTEIVVAAFGAGTAIAAVWCLVGAWQLRRLVRRAAPAPAELADLLTGVAERQPVPRLRLSDELTTAVALGLARPTILLPTGFASRHDRESLRTALAHELAHIRNGDLWLIAALRLLMHLLWAHPGYWLMRRGVRLDQELLADAAAAEVTSRDSYAEQLVGWARQMPAVRGPALAGAVGLWETGSQLRQRIRLLLDERLMIVRSCSRGWKLAALGLCAATGIGLSLVTLEPREALADEPPTADTEEDKEAKKKDADYSHLKSLEVRVVDPEGNPVEGAEVTPWALRSSMGHGTWNTPDNDPKEPPTVVTNAGGIARVPYPEYMGDHEKTLVTEVTCRVVHGDFASEEYKYVAIPQIDQATITLERRVFVRLSAIAAGEPVPADELYALWSTPGSHVGRTTVDDAGYLVLPGVGAGLERIRLVHLPKSGPVYLSKVIEVDLEAGGDYSLIEELRPAARVQGRLSDNVPRPVRNGKVVAQVITQQTADETKYESLSWETWCPIREDGTFEIADLPRAEHVQIIALCDGFAAVSGATPEFASERERSNRSSLSRPQTFLPDGEDNRITLEMAPTASVEARVVDREEKGIEGIVVATAPNVLWWDGGSMIYCESPRKSVDYLTNPQNEAPSIASSLFYGKTDGDGVATIRNIPAAQQSRERLWTFATLEPLKSIGNREGDWITVRPGETSRKTLVIDRPEPPAAEEELGEGTTANNTAVGWPATLSGEIKDDEDKPIAGATVNLSLERMVEYPIGRAQERLSKLEATTDDEGRYRFDTTGWPQIGTDPFVLNLHVSAAGYADDGLRVHIPAGSETIEPELLLSRLAPGQMVTGRVVDPQGRPVAGAVIRSGAYATTAPTVTKGDGTFKFASIGGTTYWIYSSQHARTMLPVARDATDLGDITLEKGTLIEGTVTTTDGAPVAGCVVVLEGGSTVVGENRSPPFTMATATDDQGHYQFVASRSDYHPHYSQGGYHIYVSYASHSMDRAEPSYVVGSVPPPLVAPQWIGVDGEEPTMRVDLKAREGVTLSGVVRWPDGTPAEAVEIRASDLPSPGNGVPFQGTGISIGRVLSDKKGAYRLTVPSGIRSIVLHGSPTRSSSGTTMMAQPATEIEGGLVQGSFLQLPKSMLNESRGGLDWVLREQEIQPPTPRVRPSRPRSESSPPVEWPATLSGEIKDDQDEPIAGVNVTLTLEQVHEYPIGRWDEELSRLEGTTDEEGRYEFDLSTWPELRYPPFVITVSAGAKGHSNGRTWTWYDSRDKKVGAEFQELVLPAGRTVTGKVVDADGKPVFGAVIHAVVDYGTNMMHNPRTSGPDGTFELRLSRDGGAQVWICSAAGAPKFLAITKEQTDLGTIELERGTALEGTVRNASGRPVAGCVVVMSSGYDGEMRGRSVAVQYATKTDDEGRYRLPPAIGGYKVYLSMAERTSDRPVRAFVVGDQRPPAVIPQWHELSGKEATKRADFNGTEPVELRGTVWWRDGTPAAGVEVKASYGPHPTDVKDFGTGIWIERALSDAEGKYTLKLPKGITGITLSCFGARDKNNKWQSAFYADHFEGVPQAEQFIELEETPLINDRQGFDWVLGEEEAAEEEEEEAAAISPEMSIVIAKHYMLLDGTTPITWLEIEEWIKQLEEPSKAHLQFRWTNGAREESQKVLWRAELDRLRQEYKHKLAKYSTGSVSPRIGAIYDKFETLDDFTPDPVMAVTGQVVDAQGKAVAGAEVLLIEPVDESVSNKRIDVYVVDGRLRTRSDEVVADSDATGKFTHYLSSDDLQAYLIAMHPEHGFAIARQRGLKPTEPIALQPWGTLRGNITPLIEFQQQSAHVVSTLGESEGWSEIYFHQYSSDNVANDASRYEFKSIPPKLSTRLQRLVDPVGNESGIAGMPILPYQELTLQPGEERVVDIGPLTKKDRERLKMLEERFGL